MNDTNKNQYFVYEFDTSFVEMSYSQFFEGYCILFSKEPYPSLSDMPMEFRKEFLMEMSILGDAMLEVLNAYRINYDILGNSTPVLHAHLFPRYMWEEEERRKTVVHRYDSSVFSNPEFEFTIEKHGPIIKKLRFAIDRHYREYQQLLDDSN
ncbi:TPA: HIT family protein [Streptococcus pneumoniae]|uniref:Diadenosine tetraphosphate n=1 Tax=Streptococcus pneumoniae TaxID=1313 RepID=A0A4M9XWA7_STREE|nr:HIT domain-containing protein [Streptococcus pneumoniae]MDS2237383.1 HIT domain-containing protein [Streptococcus pneumoniae]MDS2250441.1 HIT domain-containing protein [Streptococcus pneumoniae]MDS2328032.1 HIT domain-containing protein [Streptococcus pneumoniae]MDS2457414.1 HIT domain-containing protein [Streptococcus pneumoniae]MDS2463270.1 HIT domain-containing protein [Streptococcus pneumoniae]